MDNLLVQTAVADFTLEWSMFLLAICLRTTKFWFMAGSVFGIITLQSLFTTGTYFPRQVIQSTLVCVWGLRLGIFLIFRTIRDGRNSRFKCVENDRRLFFFFWTIEGVWVWVTLLPTLILNSKLTDKELVATDYIGWSVWLAGMILECTADYQKYTFRNNPANKDKWINHGLWKIVRHPNYLGEIILWIGLYVSASTVFEGYEWLSVGSLVFLTLLLTQASGIRFLEYQNWQKWKNRPQYCQYLKNTARLIPFVY